MPSLGLEENVGELQIEQRPFFGRVQQRKGTFSMPPALFIAQNMFQHCRAV
jgi:hypothetical protein